jgi:hypothetical protein
MRNGARIVADGKKGEWAADWASDMEVRRYAFSVGRAVRRCTFSVGHKDLTLQLQKIKKPRGLPAASDRE